jgi:hypothetical protein
MNGMGSEKDYEIYKQLMDLWSKENIIKTSKLQMLLLVNALLLSAVMLNDGFGAKNWPLYLGGALASLVWVLSIGRTSLFQEIWQVKLISLADKHPEDPRFHIHHNQEESGKIAFFLRIMGGIPSRYYLLGSPLFFSLLWIYLLLHVVIF